MIVADGTRLEHYEIRKAPGAGGQGAVFKAVDTTLDRTVVVKILSAEQTVSPSSLARFSRGFAHHQPPLTIKHVRDIRQHIKMRAKVGGGDER